MKRIIVAIGGGENGRLLKNGVYSYCTEKCENVFRFWMVWLINDPGWK